MNEGRIKILFNNTEVQYVSVETEQQLVETTTWKRLSTWWLQQPATYGYDVLLLALEDGSVLLLKRSEITSIGLTPRSVYQIKTTLHE